MLRASVDDGTAHPIGVLEALVDAVAPRPEQRDSGGAGDRAGDRVEQARGAVVAQLGPDWLVDSCAVIANFEMMTRIADGTGARLRPEQIDAASDVIAEQRLDSFMSARRT